MCSSWPPGRDNFLAFDLCRRLYTGEAGGNTQNLAGATFFAKLTARIDQLQTETVRHRLLSHVAYGP